MRFISIILDPSRIWTDHGVVDTERNVLICKCADGRDADTISKVLNLQHEHRARAICALIAEKENPK